MSIPSEKSFRKDHRARRRLVSLRRDEGQALVELALVIPLLLFILFAIIDFGLAINQYNDATNLSNLGARSAAVASASTTFTAPACPSYGSQTSTTSTSLANYVQCNGNQDNAALASAAVCANDISHPGWSGATTGDTIDVKVAAPFNWLGILTNGIGRIGGVKNLQSTIQSSAEMRLETSTVSTWLSNTPTTSTDGSVTISC